MIGIGQGPWFIGDDLMFTVTTHNPTTGAVVTPPGNPTYAVFDWDDTELDSGAMNTELGTGVWVGYLQLTTANGFVAGRPYVIAVTATVSGITASTATSFKVSANLPVNAKAINNVGLTGNGSTIPWGPA